MHNEKHETLSGPQKPRHSTARPLLCPGKRNLLYYGVVLAPFEQCLRPVVVESLTTQKNKLDLI